MREKPDISAGGLERSALFYLERYSASVEGVRRVLRRRIRRAAPDDPAPAMAAVEALLTRLLAKGLLDDSRFAEGRVRTLQRQGRPPTRIRQTLRAQGVSDDVAETAVAELPAEAELEAAQKFARKRRLGPWGPGELDAEARRKQLAALARAGFSLDVARQVLQGPAE